MTILGLHWAIWVVLMLYFAGMREALRTADPGYLSLFHKPSRQSWVGFLVTLAICLACVALMLAILA
jgi:hypothetical protein